MSQRVYVRNLGGTPIVLDVAEAGDVGAGIITGPGSSTDNAVVRWDGTTGELVQNSGTTLSDDGELTVSGTLAAFFATDRDGSGSAAFYRDSNITRLWNSDASDVIIYNTDGLVKLNYGQVQFPATQNPSSDVNTLDDYEEGAWTPVLTFNTPGNLSVVYSAQVGRYTKIGRLVACDCAIITSTFTHTTASGVLLITGLPFTAGTTTQYSPITFYQGITKASYTNFGFSTSGTSLSALASGSGQALAQLTAADMPTGGTVNILFSFVYST